ncbi:MAG: DEAD/DEAH box helicase [Brevinematia bacterium]
MITKNKILNEFGEYTYNRAVKKIDNIQVDDLDIIYNNPTIIIYGKVIEDKKHFDVKVSLDSIAEELLEAECSCGEKNCEHIVLLLLEIGNYDKKEILNKVKKVSTEKKLIPLEILLDFSSLKQSSTIKVKFDLADKKLARSPKNYIYEYIIDDVKIIKVTPEDDRFLKKFVSENNIYTYPDEGINLSMSQFLKMIEYFEDHPRVYVLPEHEKLEISKEPFIPKLKVIFEEDDNIKKLKIITEEDYSNIGIIANGNEKKVLIQNKLYEFNNPIPMESWITILENRFKINEKEFPKFFGKFYELLSKYTKVNLSDNIIELKPNIVKISDIDIKIFVDYNESINKLYWYPIVLFNKKEIPIKNLFDVLISHIPLENNYFISDVKEFKQIVFEFLYKIGIKDYIISTNNMSNYIQISKSDIVRKVLVNYKQFREKIDLSPRTKLLIPIEVKVIFDVDIETEGKNNFKFNFRTFLLDIEESKFIKEMSIDYFLSQIKEIPQDKIIEIGGRFFKLINFDEISEVIGKIQEIINKKNDESSLIKLLKLLSTEEELFNSGLTDIIRIKKDEVVKELENGIKSFRNKSDFSIPNEVEGIIREYQKIGYYWLHFLYKNNFGGILADDMGLGKTLQALAFVKKIREFSKDNPSLVICPTSLTHNWAREIEKFFPTLKYGIAVGKPKNREEILQNYKNYDLIITSYALLRNDINLYSDKEFEVIIVDEAQYIKNKEAKVTKYTKLLNSKIKIALTGTPIENSVADLWSIFDFIMPGLFGNFSNFIERYSNPQNYKDLAKKIQYFVLRRKKEDVLKELPSKIEQNIFVPLSAEQLRIYENIAKEIRMNIMKKVGEFGFEKSKIHILSALTKLRQICNHPGLISEEYKNLESGKLELLIDLLDDAIEGEHKVLIFSQFVEMLKLIKERLEKEGIKYSYLDGSTKNRGKVIEEFNQNDDIKVFLISLKAGGFGINLTSADIVILYDPWWNPMIEKQAMDRTHRIGQTKTVNVYKLISENTIEEKILLLQESKKALFSNVIEESSSALSNLTWEDVKNLLEV